MMNKLGKKLLLDLFLCCLLIIVMYYFITGNFLHEIFSSILIVGFFTHVIINRKYYLSLFKKSSRGKDLPSKVKLNKWVDIILLIAMIGMTITSIVISKDLFSFLNIHVTHYKFWRISHIVLAIAIVVCVIIHLYLHQAVITGHLKKKWVNGEIKSKRIFAGLMICFSLLLVIAGCKVVFSFKDGCNGNCQECGNHGQLTNETQATETENSTEIISNENASSVQEEPVEDETKPTLEEYLASLTCDGCHKGCSLLNPHCDKGRRQAEEATQKYYELYGNE